MKTRLLRLTFIVLSCASTVTTAGPDGTSSIQLTEGGNFSLALPATLDHIAFDLVGAIWVMSPEDGNAEAITEITENNRHPTFSPDGDWIAYESVRGGYRQIMLIEREGGAPTQATFGDYHHLSPVWSPDGLHLAFASNRADNFDIWHLDLETSSLSQLTFDRRDEFEPTWNSDGTWLAYVQEDGPESSILALRPGEKPAVLLTEKYRLFGPAWRPGDRVLTYVRQFDDRSQLRMLLLSEPPITKPMSQGENVHPFPVHWLDQQSFLYAADGRIKKRNFGEPSAEQVSFNAKIEIAQDAYSLRKQIFDDAGNRPVSGIAGISPTGDGRLIVSALTDLWELDSDGTLLRQLTNDAFVDTHPAVSPSGETLAYVSDRGGSLQIWTMDIETRRTRRITSESGIPLFPVWTSESDRLTFLVADHAAATNLTLKQVRLTDRKVEVLTTRLPKSASPLSKLDDWSVPLYGLHDPDAELTPDSESTEVPLSWRPFVPGGRLIVRAGRIFDGIGPDYLIDHEIVIESNRIEDVRPWTDDSDSDARVIDAKEHTVIPGLIDLSVRQTYVSGERVGRAWLAFGVTTIRETVSNLPEATERQESWQSGRRLGPRLFLAVNPCARISETDDLSLLGTIIEDGEHPNVVLVELCPSLGSDGLRQMVATVHSLGLPVAGPTPFPDLFLGADEVRIPAADSDTPPVALRRYYGSSRVNYGDVVAIAGKLNTVLISDQATRNSIGHVMFRAIAQGARIAAGSGAPATPYGLGLQAQLRMLAETGLRPFQVLKMASLDAARILGAGDDLGSIHEGKLADLVIVDGDPLSDIGDASHVVTTILNGRAYGADELLTPGGRAGSVGKLYSSKGGR